MKPKYKLKSIGAAFDALDAGLSLWWISNDKELASYGHDYKQNGVLRIKAYWPKQISFEPLTFKLEDE